MWNKKVLVVDNEKMIGALFKRILQGVVSEVVVSSSGEEALEIMREKPFDLVFLDIRLRGMSGIDLLKKIKPQHPLTEVIMITGYASVETAVEAMKLGAFDYLVKPFGSKVALDALGRALEHQMTEKENSQETKLLQHA